MFFIFVVVVVVVVASRAFIVFFFLVCVLLSNHLFCYIFGFGNWCGGRVRSCRFLNSFFSFFLDVAVVGMCCCFPRSWTQVLEESAAVTDMGEEED